MQIASGWSKGLKLETPEGLDTRPTRGRVRSAALNMLQPWISDAIVLDLFAGSGAVGLELVSRGAHGATFVEKASGAVRALKSNVAGMQARATKQHSSLSPPLKIMQGDVVELLATLPQTAFDLVWADPPYQDAGAFLAVAQSRLPRVLRSGGVFAFECGSGDLELTAKFSDQSQFVRVKQRDYGVSLITIWEYPG